jgi:hypothetical protein
MLNWLRRLTLLNKDDKAFHQWKEEYFKIVESYLSNEFETKLKIVSEVKGEYW